jgi:hypothetical protein
VRFVGRHGPGARRPGCGLGGGTRAGSVAVAASAPRTRAPLVDCAQGRAAAGAVRGRGGGRADTATASAPPAVPPPSPRHRRPRHRRRPPPRRPLRRGRRPGCHHLRPSLPPSRGPPTSGGPGVRWLARAERPQLVGATTRVAAGDPGGLAALLLVSEEVASSSPSSRAPPSVTWCCGWAPPCSPWCSGPCLPRRDGALGVGRAALALVRPRVGGAVRGRRPGHRRGARGAVRPGGLRPRAPVQGWIDDAMT